MIKKKRVLLVTIIAIMFISMFHLTDFSVSASKGKPTYTVTPNSQPYDKAMLNFRAYNSNTKHYYLLRSYLEQLEKTGGGTLVLKKGTYTVTNTLYVPSNVTIKLQDGVKMVKGTKTGTTDFNAAKSIFQFIRPSLSKEEGVYGKYDGEKNISIIGYGNATIDLNYVKDSLAIIAGHNQNIEIKNITFKNMYSGHFIEIDATKNAVISNNKFIDSKQSSGNKEAINIDTPDKLTKGWSQKWSTFDKTPNVNVKIENNTFYNLDRALGTHKYSEGKYHDNIVVRNNKIEKMRMHPIRVMNWSNSIIENNYFKDVEPGPDNNRSAIYASGAINPMFQKNIMVNIARPMQFTVAKNIGAGSEYDITYNKLSEANLKALSTNTIVNGVEDFIRVNKVYQKYDRENTDFIYVSTSGFADVTAQNSHYEGITYWSDIEVINGYTEGNTKVFRPDNKLSRSHAAVLFSRALELTEPQDIAATLKNFKDVSSDHPYAKEIAAAYEAEIFKGSNGLFLENQSLTREQMATVLVKAFNLKDNGKNVNINLSNVDPSHQKNVQILANLEITNQLDNFNPASAVTRGQFATFLYRASQSQQ